MSSATQPRVGLVTGATGYVGSQVVGKLIREGWIVRTLSRSREKAESMFYGDSIVPEGESAGPGQIEVIEGDATDRADLARAMEGADSAWYLLHNMDAEDFRRKERDMAQGFAEEAKKSGLQRIVYLGGLHPEGEELSDHLASRKEVGDVLMASGVPTAALQAGVVLGDESASFILLRHLSERLPAMIGPEWIRNCITPIAVDDVIFYLVRAADLPPTVNRTFDVGGPEDFEYAEMIDRYSRAVGLPAHPLITAPVISMRMAAEGIALATPVDKNLALSLIGSLQHDTVVKERDLQNYVGEPPGGLTGFDETIRRATSNIDTRQWFKVVGAVGGVVALSAVVARPTWLRVGALLDVAAMGSLVLGDLLDANNSDSAKTYAGLLGLNLVARAGWDAVSVKSGGTRKALGTARGSRVLCGTKPVKGQGTKGLRLPGGSEAPKWQWASALAGTGFLASGAALVVKTYQHRVQRGVLLALAIGALALDPARRGCVDKNGRNSRWTATSP